MVFLYLQVFYMDHQLLYCKCAVQDRRGRGLAKGQFFDLQIDVFVVLLLVKQVL